MEDVKSFRENAGNLSKLESESESESESELESEEKPRSNYYTTNNQWKGSTSQCLTSNFPPILQYRWPSLDELLMNIQPHKPD